MSLFGTSPEAAPSPDPSSLARQSLFDKESTRAKASASQSSLFADEGNEDAASPWNLPTPKKAARQDLIKTLLPAADVPESYIDTYDSVLDAGNRQGAGISVAGAKKVLAASDLSSDEQARILDLIIPPSHDGTTGIGRGEFHVLMALIGLAQEHEEITLDGVDERKRNLPVPSLPSLVTAEPAKSLNGRETPTGSLPPSRAVAEPAAGAKASPSRAQEAGKDALDFPETDPWGSPALHKGHGHDESIGPPSRAKGASDLPSRTTSNFTTSSRGRSGGSIAEEPVTARGRVTGGWTSYGDSEPANISSQADAGLGGDVFGDPSGAPDVLHGTGGPVRSLGGGRVTGGGVEELVVVTVLPEKEGMFLFQHRNYQVSSARRGSKVVRRYSDFVWLLDCLHKRYPFRQLPLLPPKRVAVNGNHLSADASFIEKRRRGLARFTNALVRHPILNQEQLVTMFLTVPTELSVWRKQATISVQEEFAGKTLPPTLEDSLPSSLTETFETVRSGVLRSSEIYISLCNLMERLAKRNEGLGADYLRVAVALQSATETSAGTYAVDTNDVPLLNAGLDATAKHLSASQSLLEDEARAWDGGVIEDMKRQRDTLVSVRDMFDRAERLSKDTIPMLERKIQNNETRLAALKARPDDAVKPGEIEKVEEAIIRDKRSIVAQHARGVFIKECLRDELNFFQHSQYHVSRLHQDWSQERVKYAELQADNWRSLNEEVEGMPLGE
ncbi:MAG: Sorting nexin mvp1 [Thelocarpon superellum]|nr:MAG: Sorting nexin mvp1 [Thelocarpon superellum]